MKVTDLIARAMKEARGNSKAIGDIAWLAEAADAGRDSVEMKITCYDTVDQRMLSEPFVINASSSDDFNAILKTMARIATRDAGAARQALEEIGLSDKVINAIVLGE